MRNAADPVNPQVNEQLTAWAAEPWRLDYFAAMRRLEALGAPSPRWGTATRLGAETVRIGQEPSLAFPPASFSRFEMGGPGGRVRLRQLFFGYLGPNGPLPIHLSDFIRERALNQGDRTWLSFLDMLVHRFALHFYRAWLQARPAVTLDRPGEDLYRRWIGALVGVGTAARQGRDAVFDDARLHFAGWLVRRVHNVESIESVLRGYFGVPVRVERWIGHWMRIGAAEQTRLGPPPRVDQAASRLLGGGAVLGTQVWDRQHRIRIHLGPLTQAQYRSFLPIGAARPALQLWMRQLLGDELEWDAELVLQRDEVPPTRLGAQAGNAPRLGWLSWLGNVPRRHHARDVRIPASAAGAGHAAALQAGQSGSSCT